MGRYPLISEAYQTRRDGDRRGALDLYLKAAVALGDADPLATASALRHAADLHEELGESEEARRRYLDAWDIYARIHPVPHLDLANCRRPMALWEERHGTPSAALTFWREARAYYEKAALTGYDLQPAFDECDQHIGLLSRGG